jgi:hypothetical protein
MRGQGRREGAYMHGDEDQGKTSESQSDDPKFFVRVSYFGSKYSDIITTNYHAYGSGAPRPASTISSTTSSSANRLYVRIVSPKSEISYTRNLRSNLSRPFHI